MGKTRIAATRQPSEFAGELIPQELVINMLAELQQLFEAHRA